jgi:hypothetical protein
MELAASGGLELLVVALMTAGSGPEHFRTPGWTSEMKTGSLGSS